MNDLADHLQLFRRFVSHDEAADGFEAFHDDAFWISFSDVVIRHHVAHFVLAMIVKDGAPEHMPDSVVTMLQAEVDRHHERVDGLNALLPEIDGALCDAGVDYLVLKGLMYAVRYYGNIDRRRQVDIDILVRREDLSKALAVLQGLDFKPKSRRVRKTGGAYAVRARLLRTEHALVLSRGNLGVDLHWSLRTAPAYRFDEDAIWAQRQAVQFNGRSYPTLSDEHALLLVLLSLGHDIGRGAGRLKHFLDIHQLLMKTEGTIDWTTFLRRRVDDNTLPIVVNVLDLYQRIMADRGRASGLIEALRGHADCLACCDDRDAMALLDRPKGDPRNHRWFLKVYPVRWWRDSIWWIDRNLPHPGRILVASSKATRYVGRCLWHFVRRESR